MGSRVYLGGSMAEDATSSEMPRSRLRVSVAQMRGAKIESFKIDNFLESMLMRILELHGEVEFVAVGNHPSVSS